MDSPHRLPGGAPDRETVEGQEALDTDQFDLLVIDLDGTLVRLTIDWEKVKNGLAELARICGIIPEDRRLLFLIQQIRTLQMPEAALAAENLLLRAELNAVGCCSVNACLISFIEKIPPMKPISVLSLNSRCTVERAVQRTGLKNRISTYMGREDVKHPKPHPEGLIKLMEHHKVVPQRVVFIGDSSVDRECGNRAKVKSLDICGLGIRWQKPAAEDCPNQEKRV